MIRLVLVGAALASLAATLVAVPWAAAATSNSDRALARAGVLVASDFPSDWSTTKRGQTSDARLEAAAEKIASCTPFLAFTKANHSNPRTASRNFERGQSSVTNAVSVYPSVAKAQTAMGHVGDDRIPTCLDKLYTVVFRAELAKQKGLAKKIASIETDLAPLDGVRLGDEAVVYQGTVDVGLKDGTSQTIGLGVVSVRVGDAVVGFSYTSDTDISAELQPALVAAVDRLHDAQSAA